MLPVDALLLEVDGELVLAAVVAAGDAVVVAGVLVVVVGEAVVAAGEVEELLGELHAASEASLWTPDEVLLVQLEVALEDEPLIAPTL
jgi:hypothetical protein